MSGIIKEAIALTDAKSKRHDTPISFACVFDQPIRCDEVEIEQVVINLITNAIDALKNRAESWVKVELAVAAESVVVRVIESGPGEPEKFRQKLFDPFFTTKPVGEGTGTGLSITKGILDEHKATISVLTGVSNIFFEIWFKKEASAAAA